MINDLPAPSGSREAPPANRRKTLSELPWRTYRLAWCRSDRYCEICCQMIDLGDLYYDGGPTRRACKACIDKGEKSVAAPVATEAPKE